MKSKIVNHYSVALQVVWGFSLLQTQKAQLVNSLYVIKAAH